MSTITITPAAVRPARPSSVRLTRRGRFVVFLAALALALGAALFLASGAAGTSEAGAPATEVVMVGPGDTLWGIASEVGGSEDVRSTMDEIQRLNRLDSASLQAGQKLRVPVASE